MTRVQRSSSWIGVLSLAFLVVFLAVFLAACARSAPGVDAELEAASQYKILVFTKTAGYRHASIPAAVAAVKQLGKSNNFRVVHTENSGAFTSSNLAQYRAVVFLLTTGDVLTNKQQRAFEGYIRAGGGFVGIHSASDTEYDWPWYGRLVGAYFKDHPRGLHTAVKIVENRTHRSTRHLPKTWTRRDEWYNFRSNPRSKVKVLLRLNESSYSGGTMGDHPIAWYHTFDSGRSWYTGGGHGKESYSEPQFLAHILGGIRYAAGR